MLKTWIKLVIQNILALVRDFIYHMKMKEINKRLEREKKEAKNAKEISDNLVDDFKSEYSEYLRQSESSELRRSTEEMCSDSGCTAADDKGAGRRDKGSGGEGGTSGE